MWSTTGRVTTSYETLKAMKEGGLRLLVVGFESGDPQILKNIKKGTTLELGRRLAWCRELGIKVHGTFMVGLPGESPATIEASIRFACKLDPDTIQVSLATPYPGTEFFDFCREQGYLQDDALVNGATGYQQCVVDYPGLAAADIFQAVPQFYRRFYFRPRYMARAALVMMRDPVERAAFSRKAANSYFHVPAAAGSGNPGGRGRAAHDPERDPRRAWGGRVLPDCRHQRLQCPLPFLQLSRSPPAAGDGRPEAAPPGAGARSARASSTSVSPAGNPCFIPLSFRS